MLARCGEDCEEFLPESAAAEEECHSGVCVSVVAVGWGAVCMVVVLGLSRSG